MNEKISKLLIFSIFIFSVVSLFVYNKFWVNSQCYYEVMYSKTVSTLCYILYSLRYVIFYTIVVFGLTSLFIIKEDIEEWITQKNK